jgi:hypothetical protein
VCECDDKIHGSAPCDCDGDDCDCEQKEYSLAYNVKVINETGAKLRPGLIADITEVMNSIDTPSYVLMGLSINDVSSRHAEIIITGGTEGGDGEAFDGDTIKIGKQYLLTDDDVLPTLEVMFYDMLQEADPKTISMGAQRCQAPFFWINFYRQIWCLAPFLPGPLPRKGQFFVILVPVCFSLYGVY